MIDARIIFTTPVIYTRRLTDAFIAEGFSNTFSSSAIVNRLVDDDDVYKPLFDEFSSIDCVILPSRNAIDAFVNAARRRDIPLNSLKKMLCATIGTDSSYLESFGLQTGVDAEESSTKGIVEALKKTEDIKKIAALVPRVEEIPEPDIIPIFLKDLKAIAELMVIEAYITLPNPEFDSQLLFDIKTGNYNLVAFTSGGEIEALRYILNDDVIFKNIKAACFGPFTALTADSNGLNPVVTGTDFGSFTGFAKAVKRYFVGYPFDE